MPNELIPLERIQQTILLIRGQKVMLDRDLALLYGVSTKVLKQAVRRNVERFPDDFMFILDEDEFADWRSQFVTSNADRMGLRHAPMAFTEQGVAMLSSVLSSPRAVQVNIAIMRTFVRLRQLIATHADLDRKLTELVPYVPQTAMKNKKTTTPTQGGPFALLPYVWRSMVRHQFGLRASSAL